MSGIVSGIGDGWGTQGPLREAEQRVWDLRADEGHTLDDRRSFMEMPTGLPRPRHDGRPVPYTTRLDIWTGRPDWKALDLLRCGLCASERLCGLCGEPITADAAAFGDASGTGPGRRVVDRTALHADTCLAIALANCPGLKASIAEAGIVHWVAPIDEFEVADVVLWVKHPKTPGCPIGAPS